MDDGIRYAILDTETTGLHARRGDRVIELAVLLVDEHLEELDRLDTLLSIDGLVAGTHIHGITEEDLIGAPRFADVLPRFAELMRGATLVAHYPKFDVGFLHAELMRAGARDAISSGVIDTRDLARAAGIVGSLRLVDCCREFEITNPNPHRALGDVLATHELLASCIARGVSPLAHARAWNDLLAPRREATAPAVAMTALA